MWTMDFVFVYTRKQAIADGVLIDVTGAAKLVGLSLPTAVTHSVWSKYVYVPDRLRGQDERGRLWDILWMLRLAILRRPQTESQMLFKLYVSNEAEKPAKLVQLKAIIDGGDDGRPVMTILLPHED